MAKKKDDKTKQKSLQSVAAEPVVEMRGLEAIVNQKTRHGTVLAFSGSEYVRYEWRPVPTGFEAQAEAHPYLDVRPRMVSVAGAEVAVSESGEAASETAEVVTDETSASDDAGIGVGTEALAEG